MMSCVSQSVSHESNIIASLGTYVHNASGSRTDLLGAGPGELSFSHSFREFQLQREQNRMFI